MNSDFKWGQLTPLSWLRALWKHKLLILLSWIGLGGVATAIVLYLPPVYRAEVLIMVETQRIPERFVTSTVNAGLTDRLSSLAQQITSYTSLLKIINKFDLYRSERRRLVEEEVIDLMRSHIKVNLEQGWSKEQAAAFRVTYEARDPAVAAQVANELATQFIDQNLRSREVYAKGTSEFLRAQVAEAKQRLEEQESILSEYKRQHSGELPQQETVLTASLARLQSQLQALLDESSRLEQTRILRESELNAALNSQSALQQITEQISESAPSAAASGGETEIDLLEKRLVALRSRYTENHPDVKETREALARLRAAAQQSPQQAGDAAKQAGGAQPRKSPASGEVAMSSTLIRERERVEQIRAQILVISKRLAGLDSDKKKILDEIAALQRRLSQLPVREQQIAVIARDYEISKANYQSLLDKKLAAEMAAQMENNQKSERFVVLDAARIPEKPIKPDRLLWGLGGWGLGLGISIAGAVLLEMNKNVLLGEWELPGAAPVLARIPPIVLRDSGAGVLEEAPVGSDPNSWGMGRDRS